ncbi:MULTISPECIES: FtsH protease activity modulator HflK [Methylovorus]|jgi:modulator of FtsH protease HflK|uniref:Protein HflK n=1 Tax=Methylovorus glucosotrophus (strain SIP3-4) TaxID=582744 RepID=C6XEG0_METGS|nr:MULTISPECIES: FtsH protease activity modulator HflK [Methylovorus]ACT50935.1 HflK protein [Methylovorus glucosotrophus SIP3-4]ADQ84844.1 HflK protein [Methylovorus sp. MP688]
MANDPGWGNRNNDGPPDLDEVLRQFSRKLNGLFGRSPKGGQSPQSEGSGIPVLPIVGLIAVIWFATGFYIVDQGSRGVVLRFGKHVETTLPGPRWHMPYPVESVDVINMEQVRTIEVGYRSAEGGSGRSKELRESLMLTDDENIIDLQFAVQYNLKNVEEALFNNRSAEESVRGIAETAIREIVGKSKMDFALYEGREEVAVEAKKLMQEILDRYNTGINVVNVTMQNAQPPEQVQAAFDDAVKAGQDLERQKNEGQAYANDIIPKARGTASRLLEEAAGYKLRVENEAQGNASRFEQVLTQYQRAPEVTRQRLYLDAQEQILSNVSKVVVDQKGGNSLLYLPLDKLLANTGGTPTAAPSLNAPTTTPASTLPEIDLNNLRSRDSFRSRDRESR